ncbi:hypothetical protein CHL78_000985 [Romboutsia weinsteinii]|uniref:Uncharacterized protein n=1 Tax=Romboutsia weinsteinii TaxID=2020949 RepID=A0A371JAU1_9FIRM|nr:hypothetical protein [Romboutsia weinsteinii]RDY29777.1 hypothetical protein CHL78_000985 [Romboutsia weinsteinii]
MGKKLSFEEQLESLHAIKSLYFSWDRDTSTSLRYVEVVDEETDAVILSIQVPINISPGTETYKINIVWENAGVKNFSSLKLFGIYWSSYNKMNYDDINECLEIYSSDSDKIVKVYS